MIQPLRKLLPEGTLYARVGLPATIASRGFFVACYNATESYVVLALTDVKKLPADLAGLIVAAGSLSWSTAAWLQSKLDAKDHGKGRKKRVTVGIGFMIIGVAAVLSAVSLPEGGVVFAVFSQLFTGFGIGLAHPTTGAIALQHAKAGEEGEISASLQFTDAFSPGLSIGIGGALIAVSQSLNLGLLTGILWALEFQQEAGKIMAAIGDKAICIEHIGSTAVPGLKAKPVIDMMIAIADLNDAELWIEPLARLGYEFVPKAEFPRRRFFRRGDGEQGPTICMYMSTTVQSGGKISCSGII